jgi:hypothetical protein
MIKKTVLALFCTAVSLAALYAWTRTAPVDGSGWFLVLSFAGGLGLLNSISNHVLGAIAAAVMSATSGAAWWFYRDMPHSGWVLALCILSGLGLLHSLSEALGGVSYESTKVRGGRKTSFKIKF